jgi:glycosyltransferase involved in cell wall biosynthesis
LKVLIISSYSKSLINFRGPLIKSFIDHGLDVVAAGPDSNKDVYDALSKMKVKYRTYYLERTGTNIYGDIKSYLSLKKIIKDEGPDIVLSYTIKPVIYGSLAAKRMKVAKVYGMITGLGSAFGNNQTLKSRLLSWVTELLYKMALKNIDGVIFQNPDDTKAFIDKNLVLPKYAYNVNGSGVDLDYFFLSDPVLKPIRFLFIGRLIKDKGIVEYVEASKIVAKKYPETEFHIVGWADNNPSSVTEKELNEWKKFSFLKLHGKIEDVRPFLEECSVFVLPSYREGTPRTVLESMAMGKPIITTDAPGCRETVREGLNGFLVPVKSSNKIAESMEKFINEPELITYMGNESRKLAEELFDVHKVNSDIHKIFGL